MEQFQVDLKEKKNVSPLMHSQLSERVSELTKINGSSADVLRQRWVLTAAPGRASDPFRMPRVPNPEPACTSSSPSIPQHHKQPGPPLEAYSVAPAPGSSPF
jgi:hypothetical protein